MSVFIYSTYGLRLQSTIELPELVAAQGSPDVLVSIRPGEIDRSGLESYGPGRWLRSSPEEVCFLWERVGVFLIRGGREILVDPEPGVEEALLRLFILGASLAILLHQRGFLVLHASSVAVRGRGIAFIGNKGYGKSTTAMALLERGHQLLADDITALETTDSSLTILPGYLQMKVWPDALRALGKVPEDLPRLHSRVEKRACSPEERFSGAPARLQCIYVLSQGESVAIEPLARTEALKAVMPHWYAARYGMGLLRALGLSTHFLQCAELVKNASVCLLRRPNDHSALPLIAREVEEHILQQPIAD